MPWHYAWRWGRARPINPGHFPGRGTQATEVGSENSHLEFISTTSRAVTYKKSTTCCIFPGYRHRYPSLTLRSRVAQRPLTCRMVFTSHPSLDRRTGAIQRLHTPVLLRAVCDISEQIHVRELVATGREQPKPTHQLLTSSTFSHQGFL
jgi:hypothetical protein